MGLTQALQLMSPLAFLSSGDRKSLQDSEDKTRSDDKANLQTSLRAPDPAGKEPGYVCGGHVPRGNS